jgi:hypothetical protein
VAEVFARLQSGGGGAAAATLITCVADDASGNALLSHCKAQGVHVILAAQAARSGTYCAMLDERGDLVSAVADMAAFDEITPSSLGLESASLSPSAVDFGALLGALPPFVVVDANVSATALAAVARSCAAARPAVPLVFEPISVAKCARAVEAGVLPLLALLKPNVLEVAEMARLVRKRESLPALDAGAEGAPLAAARTLVAAMLDAQAHAGANAGLGGEKHVIVTLGARGVLWLSAPVSGAARAALLAEAEGGAAVGASPQLAALGVRERLVAPPPARFAKATGAGDTLLGCLLYSWIARDGGGGLSERSVAFALEGARVAVENRAGGAVPVDLAQKLLGRL